MTLRPLIVALLTVYASAASANIDIATIECGGVEVGDDVLDLTDLGAVEIPEPLLRKCGIKNGISKVSGTFEGGIFRIDSRAEYLSPASFKGADKKSLKYIDSTPGASVMWSAAARNGALDGSATLLYKSLHLSAGYNESLGLNLKSAYIDVDAYRVGQYALPGAGTVIGVGYGYNAPSSSFSRYIYSETQEIAMFAGDVKIFDQGGKLIDTIKTKSPGVYDLRELAEKYRGSGKVLIDGREYSYTAEERITAGEGFRAFAGLRERYEDGDEVWKPFASVSHTFFPVPSVGMKAALTTSGASLSFETFAAKEVTFRGFVRHDDGDTSGGLYLGYRSDFGSLRAEVSANDARESVSLGWSGKIRKGQNLSVSATADSEGSYKYRASTSFRVPGLPSASISASVIHYDNASGHDDTQYIASLNIPLGKALKGTPGEGIFKNLNVGQEGTFGLNGSVLGADFKLKKAASTSGGSTSAQIDFRAYGTDYAVEYDFEGGTYEIEAKGQIFTDFESIDFAPQARNSAILEISAPAGALVMIDGKSSGVVGNSGVLSVAVQGDKNVRVVLDDSQIMDAIKYPDQVVAVKSGEKAKINFEYEEMQ